MTTEDILGFIYEGPMEAEPWISFLHALRVQLDAVASSMNFRLPGPKDQGFDVSVTDWDASLLRQHYSDEYHEQNPFPYAELQPGKAYRWSDFLSTAEFRETQFYREFCKPVNYEFAMCLCIAAPLDDRAWVHVVRGKTAQDFDDQDLAWCEALEPHLSRALRILNALKVAEIERTTYESAVDQLAIGTLLLSNDGRVIRSNDNAERIIAENRCLSLRDGRFVLRSASLNARFNQMIHGSIESDAIQEEGFSVPRAGRPPLGMLLRRRSDAEIVGVHSGPAMMVYLMDPATHRLPGESLLQVLFGLTATEARLSALLVDGVTIAEAAKAMHVSEGSARVYSKRVFAKMGVTRQVDLVRMIMKSVATLATSKPRPLHLLQRLPSE